MAGWARRLESAGAEGLVICTNMMHRLAVDVTAAIHIPLIHIADATATAVKKAEPRTVGLPGTPYTMELDFYRGRLEKEHGLKVFIPKKPGAAALPCIIRRSS